MEDELAALLNQAIPGGSENVMVHCPLHEDRRASLSLNLTKGVWYCHSCGLGGGVRRLAQLLGGDLDAADLAIRTLDLSPAKDEPDFTTKALEDEDYLAVGLWPAMVNDYVQAKGLSPDVIPAFRIGYDEKRKAISIPYWDNGAVRSIQYRYADGSKNQEPGGKRILYNVDDVRGALNVVVCEGESDTHRWWTVADEWSLDIYGDFAVCGVPGAASGNKRWELWSLDLLWARKVWVAFDADEAGDKGAEVALRALGDKAVRLRPEGGKDWCDPNVDWSFLNDLASEVGR